MKKTVLFLAAGLAASMMTAAPAFAMGYQYVAGPIGSHVLAEGDRGPSVTTLQGDLDQFGYDAGVADGYFGPHTEAALEAFQRDKGLNVSGNLDQPTFIAILDQGGWSAAWTAGSSSSQEGSSGSSSGSSPSASGNSGGSGATQPSGRTLTMTATAYGTSAADNYPYGPTDYFGAPLKPGDVAVDPGVIPLNTRLYICGYHSPNLPSGCMYGVARDEGSAIQGDRIDIFMDGSPQQVSNFGVQTVQVTILGN